MGAVYLPPRSDKKLYTEHVERVEYLKSLYCEHEFVIFGDYNLPRVEWSHNEEGLVSVCSCEDPVIQENTNIITDAFTFLDYKQYYPNHPIKGYTLDLVFSSLLGSSFYQVSSSDSLVPEEDHHLSSFFKFQVKSCSVIEDNSMYFDFNNADYPSILSELNEEVWEEFFDSELVSINVNKFYEKLNNLIACTSQESPK